MPYIIHTLLFHFAEAETIDNPNFFIIETNVAEDTIVALNIIVLLAW